MREPQLSGIPEEIADYGTTKTKPRQNPAFSPGSDFGTEDYYVWSRCDGASTIHDIILMVGLGTDRSIEILKKLRGIGAVLLPGESRPPPLIHEELMAKQAQAKAAKASKPATAPAASKTTAKPPAASKTTSKPPAASKSKPTSAAIEEFSDLPPTVSVPMATLTPETRPNRRPREALSQKAPPEATVPPAQPLTLDNPTPEELVALGADCAMEEQERIRIILFRRKLSSSSLFALLDVDTDTDKRNVKRAYFRLSKEFHPDRHYGKDIGVFEGWLSEVFKAITDAFKVLGNNKKRAKYEASLRSGGGADVPQTKEDHAAALFQNACDSELHGDSEQALKLFAAAIRMDEQPRYLRRAAMCAVQARELSVAEEYAKKAADLHSRDASYQRVLADVYRAGARYDKAKAILERALTLNVENDTLYGELQSDLAAVNEAIEEVLANL